jgi:SAM-dependent methyltransferase
MSTRDAMDATRAHYATLLAPIYWWMLGGATAALERSRRELHALGIGPASAGRLALDLGAGCGVQSIPLAELGYRVTAVDTSKELLADLAAARRDIGIVTCDLARLPPDLPGEREVIVCMGDTLTHLCSREDVGDALADASRLLAPGGALVLTFRDYVSHTRQKADRFLLVRADDERILSVCLDYEAEYVQVTDLLHERKNGAWTLRASTYRKLRLDVDFTRECLVKAGLSIERCDTAAGVVTLVARRPKGADKRELRKPAAANVVHCQPLRRARCRDSPAQRAVTPRSREEESASPAIRIGRNPACASRGTP